MKTLINIVTIAFVIGTLYYIARINHLPELAQTYFNDSASSVQKIFQQIPTSVNNVINAGSGTNSTIDNGNVVLPGALKKIEPGNPTTGKALTLEGVISATNTERQKQSVKVLTESSMLDASALVKAKDILARQYFEHTAPDGKTVSDLVGAQGYTYIKIGENLALGNFTNDQDVVTAWMNSPGHRANILDTDFTQIGVGIAYGSYQGQNVYVVVQHFGRPRSACPSVSDSLRLQVQNGQKDLDTQAKALAELKAEIDRGTAAGKNMDTYIDIYNKGADQYQISYDKVEALRTTYNAEVAAFNACAK